MYKSLDKEILCELFKDINIYISTKWTGTPLTIQEIEEIFNKKN